jgi:hypothetical protein
MPNGRQGKEMLTDVNSDEWVIYSPPKSVAFGHQARVRDARRAWMLTDDFLKLHTNFALNHNVSLMCCLPTEHIDASVASARIAEARTLLGPEIPDEASNPCWDIQPHQLADAIDFSLDDKKFPKQPWGPTMLSLSYLFTWKKFDLPRPPDEPRDVRSSLGVIVGGWSVFLQPSFVFPATWNSGILRAFLTHIEPALPFRIRDQYFQRWLSPSGKGSFGRTRKLDKNWRSSRQDNGTNIRH